MKDNQKKTTQKVFIVFSVLLCMLMCAFFVAFVGFELRANASSMDLVFSQEETQEIEELTRDDTQIYLSHANGNDGNDGSNATSGAIKTINRAIELLPNGGVVNVLDGIQISTSTNISPTNQIILRRTEQSMSAGSGELIAITGSNTTVRFDNIVFDGASIDSADVAKYLLTISATTSNVTFGDNVVIENNYTRGITILSGSSTITTEDLTIRNCNETNGYGFYFDFAGNPVLELYFSGLNVLNNVSDGQGGAIYLTGGNSNLLEEVYVLNSYFSGNINTNNVNGNVTYSVMSFNIFADLTVSNCRFENNQGSGNGACINYSGRSTNANVQINGCEFLNNKVNRGCLYITNVNTFLLENCYFEGQLFSPSNGAPSYACASASNLFVYTIKDCTAINNRSNAGVFQYNGGFDRRTEFNVEDCNFIDFVGKCIDIWEGGQTLSSLKVSGCNFINGTMHQSSVNAISLTFPIEEVFFDDCQFSNFNSGIYDWGVEAYGACFYINTSISKFTMSDCVFNNNANIVSSPLTAANGGAMNILSSGEYNFINCKFLNNSTNFAGGAIYIDSSTSATLNATFNNCEFGFNTSGNGGGAICLSEPAAGSENAYYGSVIFNDCYMHDNSDNGGEFGSGAISAVSAGNVTINGGIYERNSAKNGHAGVGYFCNILNAKNAIFRHNSSAGQSGTIWVWNLIADNIDVYGNYAANLGGGLFAGYATISNSNIYDNESGYGGGVYVQYLTMDNCLVENNRAVEAAGIYSITATITNSSISHNEAQTAIGALNIQTPTSTVIDGCKIIGNKAGERIGAIMFGGATSTAQIIRNCEIRDNVAIGTTSRGIIHSYSYNLVFENVIFSGNQAGTNQGLINMETSSPQTASYILEIIGGVISGNSTLAGGIIYLQSSVQFPSQVRLDGVDIYGNTDEEGAIVQVSENMVCTVIDCSFYSNAGGEKGGAISVANKGNLVISGEISFGSNSATNGGAIYVMSGGEVALSNLNLHNIESTNGIIYTEENSNFNVSGGAIYNNSGENGGVFYINGNSVIQNLEAYNNSATNGGVLYVGETGVVTLDNVNFYNNSATNGGAVYVVGLVNFKDGKIDSNTATNGGGVYVGDNGSFSMSYDLVVEIIEQSQTQEKILQESYKYGEVINNSADFGGGIYIASNGSASINGGHTNTQNEDENSSIQSAKVSSNKTNNHGGGIYVSAGGVLSINGGEVSNNLGTETTVISQGFGVYNGGIMTVNGGKISGNDFEGNTRVCYGGGIYNAENSILNMTNAFVYDNRAHDGGAIYVGVNSNVKVENSYFSSNASFNTTNRIGMGALFAVNSGNLVVNNINTENHSGTNVLIATDYTGNLKIENSNFGINPILYYFAFYDTIENTNQRTSKIELYNCNFNLTTQNLISAAYNNYQSGNINANDVTIKSCRFYSEDEDSNNTTRAGFVIRANKIEIRDSIFDGAKTQIQVEGGAELDAVITDCSFININYSGTESAKAALSITNTNAKSETLIKNCEFENNSSTTGASALYIANNARVYLSGDIIVQGNTTENAASGAVVIDNSNTVIRKGTLLLIDNNTGGNLVVQSGKEKILEGDLEEGSRVGLKLSSSAVNKLVIGGISNNYIITNIITECFYSENSAWGLKFSSSQNGLVLYDNLPSDEISIVASDKVIVSKIGQSYGITEDDIQVYFGGSLYQGEVVIEYSLTGDDASWSLESPRFSEKGEHTIYYRVSAESEILTGSIVLKLIGERVYIIETPFATLRHGQTLGQAEFTSGLVEDEEGHAVAGTWEFTQKDVKPVTTGTVYEARFIPSSSNYMNSNILVTNIRVSIGYNIVFYVNDAFHTDIDDINNSQTGISDLKQMIEYMEDDGSIVFAQTYNINGSVNIVSNKNVDITRYSGFTTGPMIVIVGEEDSLTLSGGLGKIVFEGGGAYSGTVPFKGCIIDNHGHLNLNSNVIIRNFSIENSDGDDGIYSIIINRASGEINLSGAEIYGNTIRPGSDDMGGVIYNLGFIRINGGEFSVNGLYEVAQTSVTARQGSGGFIYNLGEIIMTGGEIFGNSSNYGGGIYIGNGGIARLNGGKIYSNVGRASGGGVYVDNGGQLIIGGCIIEKNYSFNGTNGIGYDETGSIIVDTAGFSLVGEGLNLIESKNLDVSINNENNIFNYILPILVVVSFMLFFMCIIVNKRQRKR